MKKANQVNVNVSARTAPAPAPAGAARKQGRRRQTRGVSAPSAQSSVVRSGPPQFRMSAGSDARITVSHREFVHTVMAKANSVFTCVKIPINPGLSACFPWLSGIARLYESYVFRRLSFEFVPSTGTSTSGSVSMALDYDAFDDPPLDKASLMSNHSAVRGVAWNGIQLTADQSNLRKFGVQRYTRQDVLAANLDIKTYDVAALFVATDGCTNAYDTGWGDIYVTYTVELMTPQNPIWLMDPVPNTALLQSGGDVSRARPLGSVPSFPGQDTHLPLEVGNLGSTLTFPRKGQYMLELNALGTAFTTSWPAVSVLVGDATFTGAGAGYINGSSGSATQSFVQGTLDVRTPTTIGIDYTAIAATLTGLVLRVLPWNINAKPV